MGEFEFGAEGARRRANISWRRSPWHAIPWSTDSSISVFARAAKSSLFNSVGDTRMVNPYFEQGAPTMFLCGDNESGKNQVSEIIRQFGWESFACGGIIASRALGPQCTPWCIPGFLKNQWTHALKVLSK